MPSAFGQQFQREADTIPVQLKLTPVHSPFSGGFRISNPAIADIDDDGDFDLFVGGFEGRISFFRNNGTQSQPRFVLESENVLGQRTGIDVTPTFADIDEDGDSDLFFGDEEGRIHFFRNVGSASAFDFTLETNRFFEIDVGGDSAPVFVDIDDDDDLDLFVGENGGNINFYRNIGTPQAPDFRLESRFFAGVDVSFDSHPRFADIDADGDQDLFIGEDGGNIHFYRNVGTPQTPIFSFETENFAVLVEFDSAPEFFDLDADGDLDLLVGDNIGNMNYYQNTGTHRNPFFTQLTNNLVSIDVGEFCSVTLADINNDSALDLFFAEDRGRIHFYRNEGTSDNPSFLWVTNNFASINLAVGIAPTFADIDNDNDPDLFVGEDSGHIRFYRNDGTAFEPHFELIDDRLAAIDVGTFAVPAFADIDDDGDLDLFIGESEGHVHFYRNSGTAGRSDFTLETSRYAAIDVGDFSAPTFADIDLDGDLDLFVGDFFGEIHFFQNKGTPENPNLMLEAEQFGAIDVGDYSVPIFADIENDGDSDLFIGNHRGGVYFYRNTFPTSVSDSQTPGIPKTIKLDQNFPNPFNPQTTIQYELPKSSHVTLIIHNLLGQQVKTLVDAKQQAGVYSVKWEGKDDLERDVASGIYLYKLQTPGFSKVRKLTLLR
ncbi:T9SS type A sorting domain-containing protein [candidate division KSB1 bacterium]|nr:T9SS type A sorting domain-containing protein [candidate division KSB1 bacterium]NIR73268.1 T9SS type A sorting domain-containing protein [candidate division KSB1 bacterium]NIS26974.1 T9SS type A sorting domain-containing protein [candidate division KSB1 bacterium]NIT73813.1 T9SS type A sorting domain-containing protein [candidate division KSB1 bacterium]NIU27718.1 T9SS type A sorting domain-containing protein [candidate division KSB1 bacterium]